MPLTPHILRRCEGTHFTFGENQMIDFDKPVQTRGGESVRIVSIDGHPSKPIVGYIGNAVNPNSWNSNGT